MLLAAPSPGRSPALPKAFSSVRRREAPTLRVLVHGARWRPHPRVGAGPHPHALHLPVPGVLGHSLLVHRVHGLQGEQSSLLCHPPGLQPLVTRVGWAGAPCWRCWWPRGTHWGGVLIQHPGHVLVTPLWGTHFWGPHPQHPTLFGHLPMGNPLWGSSA